MRIAAATVRPVEVPLARPYAIHGHSFDVVGLVLLELRSEDGLRGFGQAAPAEEVTGETCAAASRELGEASRGWLLGCDPHDDALLGELSWRCRGPAARAAIDIALCDLIGRAAGVPCVDVFGRVCGPSRTSITIGHKTLAETLAEAEEYAARGFTAFKVKTGAHVDGDLERLRALRRRFGPSIALLVDANQGLDERGLSRFLAGSDDLALELIEQPLPPGKEAFLRTLPATARRLLCADESVLDEAGLLRALAEGFPYGAINIKLQKCGGPRAARRLARICAENGIDVMWGCNDESALGIAAALHAACSSAATRWLDLDGSLDLAADPFTGGFTLHDDTMHTLARPGFGVEPAEAP
ncbi:MAG: enolase C-terminal domain-like protein [Planctomycetota bacterium]